MLGRSLKDVCGQGTVELSFVMAVSLSILIACALLWHLLAEGTLVEHAMAAASHHIQSASQGAVGDVFLY
jgi:hypothetical protein